MRKAKVKIILNGKEETLLRPMTVREMVNVKGWNPDKIVVELNREIVGKEAWTDLALKENDKMEILSFVGGGNN